MSPAEQAPAPDLTPVLEAVADVKLDTETIIEDTDELQTDWHDGGRLDTTLDNLITTAQGVPDVIGGVPTLISFQALHSATGAALTGAEVSIRKRATGEWWDGNSWETSVSYIPMTHILGGAHEYEMTYDDAGKYNVIFSNDNEYMIPFSYVQNVYLEERIVLSELLTLLRGGGAKGSYITAQIDNVPVADADVWITTDPEGENIVAGTHQTDSNGNVQFWLDSGLTYYVWIQKDGCNFTNPTEVVW
jgi:hypothetical protein